VIGIGIISWEARRAGQRVADRPDPRTHPIGATPHGAAGTGRNVGDPPVQRLGQTRKHRACRCRASLRDVVARALHRLLPRQDWRVRPRRANLLSMGLRRCAYRDLPLNLRAYVSVTDSMSSSSGVLRPHPLATKRACRWSSVVRRARPSAVSDSISESSVASR